MLMRGLLKISKIDQHEELEVKESVEAKEPCVFNANKLCLIVDCTRKRKIQLLNTIMKVEEDECLHIGWYVFIRGQ